MEGAELGGLLSLLKNPAYAGAFAYGRRVADPVRQVPGRPATGKIRQPRDHWLALVKDVYPAYITWEEHERILATIEENRQKMAERLTRKQAIRSGEALLTGLVRCGRCGHAMQVIYKDNRFQYICIVYQSHQAKPNCQYLAGGRSTRPWCRSSFACFNPPKSTRSNRSMPSKRNISASWSVTWNKRSGAWSTPRTVPSGSTTASIPRTG